VDAEQVSRLRKIVGRLTRQINSSDANQGLTASQASVLGAVATHGPFGLTELVEFEGLNPTMLSRLVHHLVDAGLIERLPHPSDLRTAWVRATDEGQAVNELIRAQRTAIVAAAIKELTARQVNDVVKAIPALEALADQLQERARAQREGQS